MKAQTVYLVTAVLSSRRNENFIQLHSIGRAWPHIFISCPRHCWAIFPWSSAWLAACPNIPDRPFHNFRSPRSGDRRISSSSGMSCDGIWSFKVVKGSVGLLVAVRRRTDEDAVNKNTNIFCLVQEIFREFVRLILLPKAGQLLSEKARQMARKKGRKFWPHIRQMGPNVSLIICRRCVVHLCSLWWWPFLVCAWYQEWTRQQKLIG